MKKYLFWAKFAFAFSSFLAATTILSGQPAGGYNLVYADEFDDGTITWGVDQCVKHQWFVKN